MTEVTWKILAKEVDDKKTIEEEIDEDIKTHTEDPSAHGQTGEAVAAHRAAEILDHLDKCIEAIKLKSSAQVNEVVVAPSGGDYTDIQSAIDDGKKRIYVKAGTYEISSRINILTSDITIRGEDRDAVIIKIANNADCDGIRIGNGGTALSGITIENIQIDGNAANQPSASRSLIYFFGGAGALITESRIVDCYLHDSVRNGIKFQRAKNCTISNNRFESCGVVYSAGYSIEINWYCTYNIISNNHCIDGYDGFRLIQYCSYNTIMGNTFENNEHGGITVSGADSNNNKIAGNVITGGDTFSILIGGNANFNSIIGNKIESSAYGLWISNANYNSIIGNQCSNNGSFGLHVEGDYNSIIGNQFNSNSYGIYLSANWDGSIRNVISGNQCNSNTNDGIHLYGFNDNNIISGNVAMGNGGYGVNIRESGCDKNVVTLNQLSGNTSGGINDAGTNTQIGHNIE